MRARLALAVAVAGVLAGAAPAPAAFDPAYEQRNYAKIDERAKFEFSDPAFQADLRRRGLERQVEKEQIRVEDPERDFTANLCSNHQDGCAGDIRLYDWAKDGHGLRTPVLFTARNGATLSGHVWMTKTGPARRPGIVVTPGSVQAPEELYWWAGATLAKRGYVVLTYDVQGQGYADTYGEAPDRNEGVPAQAGRPFFDQTEDALDFFLSTQGQPFVPRPSCTSATSHAPKQARRVAEGRNAAYNPFAAHVDPERIGLVGHSFGASGVSFVGQKDPRVDAILALDNLREPDAAPASDCASAPASRAPAPATKPALGISNDYGLFRQPNTSEPDPLGKSAGSFAYSKAGVETGELVIRGGTHYEHSYIPNQFFSATLRGIDLVAWYASAWFDRTLKADPTATARLLTTRWREDRRSAEIDPDGDANVFSRYHRSRLALKDYVCEDVRAGCPGLAPDPEPADYGYLRAATAPDVFAGSAPPAAAPVPSPAFLPAKRSCRSRRALRIRIARAGRPTVRSATVFVNGRRVKRVRGKRLRVPVSLRGLPRGRVKVRVVVRYADGTRAKIVRTYRTCARKRR